MDLINKIYRKLNKLPKMAAIEACSMCQLNCRDCYMRRNKPNCIIGNGYLTFNNFKKFVDTNWYIKSIELSLSGEIFLNPELEDIIKYAYKKRVQLTAFNGVNFNSVSEHMLETLVKYKFAGLTLSIDGTSNQTYQIYRRNGDLNKVIHNINKLNEFKEKYKSKFPVLQWQFIVFEHNKHEILSAPKLQQKLKIACLYFKQAWNSAPFDTETKQNILKAQTKIIKDNDIYRILNENNIVSCLYPWLKPQINWNGDLLGCFCQTSCTLDVNVFKTDLKDALNSTKMKFMKDVLSGKKKADNSIYCGSCLFFEKMKEKNVYINPEDIKFI